MKYLLKRTLLIVSLIFSGLVSQAQGYPIEVTLQIIPPYPTTLDYYLNNLDQGLVQVNNSSLADIDVYFRVSFKDEGNRIRLEGPNRPSEFITFLT